MKIKREENSNTYSVSVINDNSHKSESTPDNTSSDTCLITSPKKSTLVQFKTKGKIPKTSTIIGNCIDSKYLLQDWGLTFNLKQSSIKLDNHSNPPCSNNTLDKRRTNTLASKTGMALGCTRQHHHRLPCHHNTHEICSSPHKNQEIDPNPWEYLLNKNTSRIRHRVLPSSD